MAVVDIHFHQVGAEVEDETNPKLPVLPDLRVHTNKA
jgi:hypothetical protein